HGIGADGRPLMVMPSNDWTQLSDEDAAAIVAYVRALQPVDRTMPPARLTLLTRGLYLAKVFPLFEAEHIDHATLAPARMDPRDTLAYGRYLTNVGGCTGCHGPGLSGGPIPGAPSDWRPPANITPGGIGSWTEADFRRALRTGVRPNGSPIDKAMPWRLAGQMSDGEIDAVWRYLQTVPAK